MFRYLYIHTPLLFTTLSLYIYIYLYTLYLFRLDQLLAIASPLLYMQHPLTSHYTHFSTGISMGWWIGTVNITERLFLSCKKNYSPIHVKLASIGAALGVFVHAGGYLYSPASLSSAVCELGYGCVCSVCCGV